jgi:hypothetical protein
MALVYLRNPITKAVYGTIMAIMGIMALDSKPWVGLLLLGVAALAFWNAAQQWKEQTKNSPRN